ncbi:APC family permease [Pseudonocardiaceae bacterium YIM PH 21723]|nr:APC family permease [Pseudonocardiaceae bacterium YIM PH 21723]
MSYTAGLRKNKLGTSSVAFFVIAAAAPLTVVAGGLPTAYAITGLPALPLVYLVVGLVLALFTVGYAALSHHVANAGAFYSYVARGLGPAVGVGAALVAVVAYNALQISLYGFLGVAGSALMRQLGWGTVPWFVPAFACIGVVFFLGMLRIELNAQVLAVLLAMECLIIVAFDVFAISTPADGVLSAAPLLPRSLDTNAFVPAICLAVASYSGFESAALYSEECRRPRRTVAMATYVALALVGLFYAGTAWAMAMATGPDRIVTVSRSEGPDLLFHLGQQLAGGLFGQVAPWFYLSSVFAALLAFHNAVSRYLFALGREGVLPRTLGRVSNGSGAPVVGALAQSLVAGTVVTCFALGRLDPILNLSVWLAGLGALGILLLIALTSAAVVRFFWYRNPDQDRESRWARLLAPALSTLLLTAMTVLVTARFDVLIGDRRSALGWIIPALVFGAMVLGIAWGLVLRSRRPVVYQQIGHGAEELPGQRSLPGFADA